MNKLVNKMALTLLAIVLLIAGIIAGGCASSQNSAGNESAEQGKEQGNEPYQIGAVVDISGNSSSLGVPERDTLLMLVDQLNQAGGINGHPVELTILDNKSEETEAVLAVKKLIEKDVLAVLGCSSSGPSMAMINTVQSAEVPMMSMAAASSIVEPVNERQWVFKTAQSDIVTVENIITYLKARELTKVAFLYMNNAYGDGGKAAFTTAAKENGIEIAAEEKFEASDKDMTPQLTKVKAGGAQAAVVWAIPPSASIITKNFKDMGLSIPLIHSHGVGNQQFIELAQGAAEGVILPIGKLAVASQIPDSDPQKKVLESYMADYQAKYNTQPNSFGGYAWDAFNLVVAAIEKAGPDRAAIRDELEKTSGFSGISGTFNMSPQDHNGLGVHSMVLVQIKDSKWQLIE
ncbi:branched-chain amino acid transport system substrate-binding protein [Desulfotomaculum arcticum]|uniref:Branched-chain amino acid transport system substrate-binding protein n=2 Tax=Desulfotruncus TaxID=2867377 RepID=A0A1I2PQK3_9FIRM|nr:branched-chain amino acid transport system substrate-binding protein [Desulfotomaculum arcticum] [Desulfotruncus arcticus DSM 17038]